MTDTTAMAAILIHYWAGAKAAAGVGLERFDADSVTEALDKACAQRSDPHFERVLGVSSVLVDGLVTRKDDRDRPVTGEVHVEVLPPFAGGSELVEHH